MKLSPFVPLLMMLLASHAVPAIAGREMPRTIENVSLEAKGMSVTLLGTGGGPQARADRSEPATLITVDDAHYLFDVGGGASGRLAQAGMKSSDIGVVFLTHLHADHVGGLPNLIMLRWAFAMAGMPLEPLLVIGPPGTSEMTGGAIAFADIPTETLRGQRPQSIMVGQSVSASDVMPGTVYQDDNIAVVAVENSHYDTVPLAQKGYGRDRSYSYRVESKYGVIVITGDTGPSEAVTGLAIGADILVSEVINIPAMIDYISGFSKMPPEAVAGIRAHMEKEHLAPEKIGELAKEAGVGKVLLTHISNLNLTGSQIENLGAQVSTVFAGPVVVGTDLTTVKVGKNTERCASE